MACSDLQLCLATELNQKQPSAFGGGMVQGAWVDCRLVRDVQGAAGTTHSVAYCLTPSPRGALSNLVPKAVQAPQQPGQLSVAIRAVGLNFRDILNVLGLYPGGTHELQAGQSTKQSHSKLVSSI
jgi:hypothetical protein